MDILEAKLEDARDIALLNDAVQRLHAEQHLDIFKYPTDLGETERFFRDRISNDDHFIFLASQLDQSVGYVWCAIERKPENVFQHGQERLYIHQLTVEPEHRRKGVAIKLMHAVEDLAMKNGVRKFALDSWAFNKDAHAFFEHLGFSCFNINMWRGAAKD